MPIALLITTFFNVSAPCKNCKTAKSVILRKLFKFRNQSSADHVVKESKKPIAFRGKIAKLSFLRKTRLEVLKMYEKLEGF